MKRMIPLLLSILLLTGCGGNSADATYQQIDQEAAKEMMDTQEVIILRFADAGKWNISLAYDGVHFTEQGHRAFAAGLLEELK